MHVFSTRSRLDALHHMMVVVVVMRLHAGPWPPEALAGLPPGYVALAEACWARQAAARPPATEVLQRLVAMLAHAQEEEEGAVSGGGA